MQRTAYGKARYWRHPCTKTLLIMKMLFLLLTTAFLQVSARSDAQGITLNVQHRSLEQVFQLVEAQTPYRFIYSREALAPSHPVTLAVQNETIERFLQRCLEGQPLAYVLDGHYVILKTAKPKQPSPVVAEPPVLPDLTGRVMNEKGEGLEGITVSVKGRSLATVTDAAGRFRLADPGPSAVLLISGAEIEPLEVAVNGRTSFSITVESRVGLLNETVVKGYYSSSRLLNTGSVSTITAKEIAQQPVSNVLSALQGRAPGLLITQSSGIPGASFQLGLRGQQSIAQGNDPYILIDGIPFAPNNSNINQVGAAFSFSGNGLSPLSTLNPADIERIEILKDADATAIYGSKGANGVILITTKKGQAGATKVHFRATTGFSRITRRPELLGTRDYVAMRKEAFANDGVTMTPANAYDILVWDTTRYTDWVKELIGGTAHSLDAQLSVSGGSAQTQFVLSNGYHRETTVYPGDLNDQRGSLHFQLNHGSTNKKFNLQFSGTFSAGRNEINASDLAKSINLVPNLPALYDSAGNLNWTEKGYTFTNPLASLRQRYTAKTENFIASVNLSYLLAKGLQFKTAIGYNTLTVNDQSLTPIASRNPSTNPTGSAQTGHAALNSFSVEPQLHYQFSSPAGKLELLAGASWQQQTSSTQFILASGYTNDALLTSLSAAASLNTSSTNGRYRYGAFFGRAGYQFRNRYLLNLTGRRDGSSRFGPGRQFANFGAVGTGWIFSNERFFSPLKGVVSSGKIRMSYGSAGNDNIGDYQYLDKYGSTSYAYQGVPGLVPSSLFNPDYSWEVNRKLEFALEMGFWQNRYSLTLAFFRNRSRNQLVPYSLPSQTGFTSILQNFPALVQNRGWELEFLAHPVRTERFQWTSSINLTFPQNRLLEFPNLALSSYRNQYVIGQPLNIGNGFRVVGVNPQTGVYEFVNAAGNITSSPVYPADLQKAMVSLDPVFYGGFRNSLHYGRWDLDLFFEFRQQQGFSTLENLTSNPPGTRFNQPISVLARWQKPGNNSPVQRYTSTTSNPAYQALNLIAANRANLSYTDASYVRLKNVSLQYSLPPLLLGRWKLADLRLFVQGQNLLTFTGYEGSDPETQQVLRLPPLKTIAAGIQVQF